MYTGKCVSPERSGIIDKSRDYNDYCCLCTIPVFAAKTILKSMILIFFCLPVFCLDQTGPVVMRYINDLEMWPHKFCFGFLPTPMYYFKHIFWSFGTVGFITCNWKQSSAQPGARRRLPLPPMNRLNKTESAVFKLWMLYFQRIFLQIIWSNKLSFVAWILREISKSFYIILV